MPEGVRAPRSCSNRRKRFEISFDGNGSKLTDSRLSTINVFAEGLGSLAFLGHVLGAIVAHGEVLSGRDISAERRLQVPQPVALLKSYLGLAIACVGDPGLGAYLGCWCGQVVML